MNVAAQLKQAREHVHRSIGQHVRHARQYVTDSVRRAKWLAECESAVALGKLRTAPVEDEVG